MNNFVYCPYCRSKLKHHRDYYDCLNCKKTIYKHPALTASIYPIKNGKMLLCTRAYAPKKGKTDAIGGFLKTSVLFAAAVRI